jgi:hypothetical protein
MAWRSTDAHLGRAEPDRERLGNLLIETVLDITQDQDTALDGIQPLQHTFQTVVQLTPQRNLLRHGNVRIGDLRLLVPVGARRHGCGRVW